MTNTYNINSKVTAPLNQTTNNLNYTITGWTGASTSFNPILTIPADGASLEVKGQMIINGVDLEERLKTIEKVLHIPERDAKLEARYPKLKKMYDDYIKELSKYRMWENIKGEKNERSHS